MTLVPPAGERALPALAGLLLALSYPPLELLVPAFVGLVPLLVFIAERPPGPAGRWSATRAGLLAGTVYFGLQLYWMAAALIHWSALAIPAYAGAVLSLAGLVGAFAWAVHLAREGTGLPLAVLAALFWTALEWVQGHLGDLSFPWLGLGTALAPFPALAGAADLVGARGLTLWIAAANGMIATLVLRYRHGRPARRVALALGLLLTLPAGYGIVRSTTLELRPAARVAVVQPNIPEELKLDGAVAVDTSLSALSRLTASLEGETLDLVVWPEVALPLDLAGSPSAVAAVRELSRRVGAPILVGAYGAIGTGAGSTATNSAYLVDGEGIRATRYDKRRLVPFVERVPFVDPARLEGLTGELRWFGGLGRGREAGPFDVAGLDVGVLVCFESTFPGLSRRYRRQGVDLLVNITNDAWFGRSPWYARTTALWQHPAHMVLRAIENRVGVARAANTGISMFVDPLGRTHARTPLFQPAVRVETVFTTAGLTPYARWGGWSGAVVMALAAAVAVAAAAGVRGPGRGSRP